MSFIANTDCKWIGGKIKALFLFKLLFKLLYNSYTLNKKYFSAKNLFPDFVSHIKLLLEKRVNTNNNYWQLFYRLLLLDTPLTVKKSRILFILSLVLNDDKCYPSCVSPMVLMMAIPLSVGRNAPIPQLMTVTREPRAYRRRSHRALDNTYNKCLDIFFCFVISIKALMNMWTDFYCKLFYT